MNRKSEWKCLKSNMGEVNLTLNIANFLYCEVGAIVQDYMFDCKFLRYLKFYKHAFSFAG